VIACAAIPSARSIEVVARMVDEPMDEWTTYALKQAVQHLRPHWLSAFQRGDVSFAKPSHLAAVLNEIGGRDVLEGLKKLVDSHDVSRRSRASAIAAIVAVGGPTELQQFGLEPTCFTRRGKYDADAHANALKHLIEAGRYRDARPTGDLVVLLGDLMAPVHPQLRANALTLAGMWKVEELQNKILAAATNDAVPMTVRAAAFRAMVDMKLPESGELLTAFAQGPNETSVRSVAIQSLAALDARAAAEHAAELLRESDLEPQDATATIAAFLIRAGGAEALAASLGTQELSPKVAKQLLRSLFATGRSSQVLFAAISQTIGAATTAPDYSDVFVEQLAGNSSKLGRTERGKFLFNSMACGTCHKVDGNGGEIGPELTAIGTTLSSQRIVEELLWPNRQVKEGYSVLQVVTDEGKIVQGYERRTKESRASGELIIKELSTGELVGVKRQHIEETLVVGSAMPTGMTSVLSRPQLLDLIRYLSELGKIK
jgi:putative heme-binding domain-containing protein